jgi:hypothetical protein
MRAESSSATSSGEDYLANPILWREFLKRLSGDPARDAVLVRSFSEAGQIDPARVVAKMKAHCHPNNTSRH